MDGNKSKHRTHLFPTQVIHTQPEGIIIQYNTLSELIFLLQSTLKEWNFPIWG